MQEFIKETVKYLKQGKTILYPTDTVWGIGCDATNTKAVDKVYKLKRRAESKSLIILVDSEYSLNGYMKEVPAVAYDLIESIDKPLTIIYPNARNLAKNVIASDGTVAIRVVKNDFCQEVIRQLKKPIVSTSANISSEPTPVVFNDITDDIKNGVDYIVDLDQHSLVKVKPSTIIKLNVGGEFEIIRK